MRPKTHNKSRNGVKAPRDTAKSTRIMWWMNNGDLEFVDELRAALEARFPSVLGGRVTRQMILRMMLASTRKRLEDGEITVEELFTEGAE